MRLVSSHFSSFRMRFRLHDDLCIYLHKMLEMHLVNTCNGNRVATFACQILKLGVCRAGMNLDAKLTDLVCHA